MCKFQFNTSFRKKVIASNFCNHFETKKSPARVEKVNKKFTVQVL